MYLLRSAYHRLRNAFTGSHCSEPCGILPRRTSVRLERQARIAVSFRHLSMSNFPPTELELYEIQTTILPDLDQDILAVKLDASVTTALESLEQERDALEDLKRSYEDIISTQRRIPPEIWSEIFLYGDSMDWKREFDWPFRTIWQLSQVCQTWRNVALSLHSCWSSIELDFSSRRPAPEKDVELLSLILERSRQHSLNITLLHHGNENLPVSLCRMRDKVFAESHRWRTARLVDYHQVRPDLLYAPLRGRLPQLEHLEFGPDIRGIISDDSVVLAFEDCPRLVTVCLTGADPRTIELPVEQITCLRLYNKARPGYFRPFVDLVNQCPLLESLRVDLLHEAEQDSLVQSLTLPFLRELDASHPDLLDSLTLPRLEVATLSNRYSSLHYDTLYAFHCLIGRSNCASNLTELRIMQVPWALHHSEPHLLLSVLSQTTGLTTLQLEPNMFDFELRLTDEWSGTQLRDVMNALAVVAGQRVVFLPRLVSLDIDVTGHDNKDGLLYLEPHDDFIALLKGRHEVGLRRFHFGVLSGQFTTLEDDTEPVFNDHEISALRGLAADGMCVDIRFNRALASGLGPSTHSGWRWRAGWGM
ncbi:hypothetical protein CPB85DRAFT_134635 [Mucidula mucida]|nr:hypothetical protein CPB85DRAFT_134635 [Mucidula mucida]